MYFADLLYTTSNTKFKEMVRTAELPQCPPLYHDQMADFAAPAPNNLRYVWTNRGREVLSHAAPFAVVRWTNLFFDAENGWNGDWFGGRLRRLFGKGILDIPVKGNLPNRTTPGISHGSYFKFSDDPDPDGVAKLIQRYLELDLDLLDLLITPRPLDETRKTL
jgi:hypothetical protein